MRVPTIAQADATHSFGPTIMNPRQFSQRHFSQRHFPLFVATLVALSTGSIAGAEDYDELFAQTDDQSFAFFDQENGGGQSNLPDFDDVAEPQAAPESLPAPARANDFTHPRSRRPGNGDLRSPSDLRLTDRSGSPAAGQRSTAMQIRQARALAEMRSRNARLEAERWGLLPSLRPSWPSNLMMSGQSRADITYFVPVYIRGH